MKNLLRYIFLFVASVAIAGFLIYTTMAFWGDGNAQKKVDTEHDIKFSVPNLTETKIDYTDYSDGKKSETGIFSANFGRLSSAFFRSSDDKKPSEILSREGKLITTEKMSGIFSWYDPFTLYELQDTAKTFKISQITSGSAYISFENDGSISIYSIDLVANLAFLSNDQQMTEMIIFPGMKVRFDPRLNPSLKDADLLRIMQVLGNAKTANANTGIEFLYPRIEAEGNLPTIFGLAQITPENRKLFNFLEKSIMERVKAVDSMKQYANLGHGSFAKNSDDSNIVNPTKNMYRMLGELQIIFSKSVNGEITPEDFRTKVVDIRNRSKEFGILQSRVDELLQKFLIDGRFALYSDSAEINQYKKLYNEAANILGITPADGKWKFFQALSDIFSKSIIVPEKTNLTTSIETATALKKTLEQREIASKDYFDIALYSFSIFQKISWDTATNKNTLTRSLLEWSSIFELYATIFQATQNYVANISDKNLQKTAQLSLVTEFYEPMLRVLVNSLYSVYTTHNDGIIALASPYVNRWEAELSAHNHAEIIKNLKSVYSQFYNDIFTKKIASFYIPNNQTKTTIEMQSSRLLGFVDMVSGEYRQYQTSPFMLESASVALPRYDVVTKKLVRKENIQKVDTADTTKNTNTNSDNSSAKNPILSDVGQVAKMLSISTGIDISEKQVKKIWTFYQIVTTSWSRKISFRYIPNTSQFYNFNVIGSREIEFSDVLTADQVKNIMQNISVYDTKILSLARQKPPLSIGLVSISLARKQISINGENFPL